MFGTKKNVFKSKFNTGNRLIVSDKHKKYISSHLPPQKGSGIGGVIAGKIISTVGDKTRSIGGKVPLVGSRIAKKGDMIKLFGDAVVIANKFTSMPQTYKGERHMILKNSKGEFVRASAMGPGTRVMERIHDGKFEPVSFMDGVSAVHDIDYFMAKNEDEVRDADIRMMSKGSEASQKGLDDPVNILQGQIGMKSKMLIEDNLGVPTTFFTAYGPMDKTPTQLKEMAERREVLKQKGYGTVADQIACEKREHLEKHRPSRALYRSLCKQTKTQKKKAQKKKKYHKIVKERVEAARKVDDEFNSKAIPNSVINAIKSMKF